MTNEQMSTALELALYRVGDRLLSQSNLESQRVGMALREVAEEFRRIVLDRSGLLITSGG